MSDAGGKCVKIVAQLLPQLPTDKKYRNIFMERPLTEVISSQRRLLQRLDREGGSLSDSRLGEMYRRQMTAVRNLFEKHSNTISIKSGNYHDALRDASQTAESINLFFGGRLDTEAMANAIAPQLRNET